MLKINISKHFAKSVFVAFILFTTQSWAQTAVVTSIPVPIGDIANGSQSNTIYGFRVDVGNDNIALQNLTINFAGTFPSKTPSIRTVIYQNNNMPYNPYQSSTGTRFKPQLITTGGTNITNNWNHFLYADETYYVFIQANFSDVGSVTGVGSTISATIPSLSAIEFSSINPVTVTGNVSSGNTYSVVNSAYIITPLSIPSSNIQPGSQYIPILGYKIETASNILTDIVQSNIITSITGTYVSSIDGIDLQYYYSSLPTFDINNSSIYSNYYDLTSNAGFEIMNTSTYYRSIYKSIPKYVYLVINNFGVDNGHTISASIDPKMFTPSITGPVFTGNIFTFINPIIPTLTVPSALNSSGFIAGTQVYNNLYTFAITAPANSNFVLNNIDLSLAGVGNTLSQFTTSAGLYLSAGMTTPFTANNIANSPNWNYNNFDLPNTTQNLQNISAFVNETIPAGQTRYFTLATYQNNSTINSSIQVLGINAINGTTFAGMSAAGGIKMTASLITFQSINTNSGLNISPYGEQLIYQFNGNTNGFYLKTQIQNLVVTLTGNVNPADISSVKLKYTEGINIPFTQGNLIGSVSNPNSNVITFTGLGGDIYYNQKYQNAYFITVQLKTPTNPTVIGKNIGLAAIDPSQNFAINSNASQTSIVGSNFQTGATYTYTMPMVSVSLSTLAGNNLLGINQSITPVYSMKINATDNALISSLNLTTTGTYTNSDIQGFYLVAGDNPEFDLNNSNTIGSLSSNSAGSGEVISFVIEQELPKGTNYIFVVPIVGLTTTTGHTIQVKGIPTSAFVFASTLIGITSTLPAGNIYTIATPMITFTGIPGGGNTMAENGNVKSYTVQINSNAAFVLNSLGFITNGKYDVNGLNTIYTYYSTHTMADINGSYTYYYNDYSNLSVLTTSGETINSNGGGIVQPIPAGISYITFFLNAGNVDNQSFGIAGIEPSITTVIGTTITYINNMAGMPTTVLGQLITLTSVALNTNPVARADNQLVYAAKYVSNVNDYFSNFSMLMKGSFQDSDFKTTAISSFNVWMDTSPMFNTTTAIKISDPANGATNMNYANNYYSFNNNSMLNANIPYYFFVTVDVSPTATMGDIFHVYGEDPNTFDSNFKIDPIGNYKYDKLSSLISHGIDKAIVGSNPLITFSDVVLTVGGPSLNISSLLTTNSTGIITYSITGTAASLSGTSLTPIVPGQVTITAYITSASGFNASSLSTIFTIVPISVPGINPTIIFSGATLTVGGPSLDVSILFATNSTGAVSYSITGVAASLSGSSLTAVTAGQVNVTVYIAAATGFNSGFQTAIFTIVPMPSVPGINPLISFSGATLVMGATPLNLSSLLFTNSTGMVSYSITGTAASLSGTNLTPVMPGQVTVTVYITSSVGFNAGSKVATFMIVTGIDPLISFSGATLIVGGAALNISSLFASNSTGIVSFSVNGSAASLTGTSLNPIMAGQVTITSYITSALGFNAGSRTAIFTIVPRLSVPGINPMITFSGATLTVGGTSLDISTLFATNSTGMVTYSISGTVASLSGSTLSPITPGQVTITVHIAATSGFNEGSLSAVFTIVAMPSITGIAVELNSAISLYPNPTNGIVNIQGDFDTITITDIIGVTLYSSTKSTFDLSFLNPGLYFVRIARGSSSIVKRIIKK